jgi:hypothetical protein
MKYEVSYTALGTVFVEADSPEAAMEKAKLCGNEEIARGIDNVVFYDVEKGCD